MINWRRKKQGQHRPHPIFRWVAVITGALLLLLVIASFFLDGVLRRVIEQKMNQSLDGYTAQLGEVDFHPIGLSITVRNLLVRQNAHPEPPVALFPEIDAGVHWREIVRGRLVADWQLDAPQLHINLQQLKTENEDETPVEERGWQEAALKIYPLKINQLIIRNGKLTYIDEDPEHPLELSGVNLTASNIRNIRSPENTYPSPFHLDAQIFGRGYGRVDGVADFLAQPQPGINAEIDLRDVPLERFGPLASKANVHLSGGILTGSGRVEYSPQVQQIELADLTIAGLHFDYVHSAATAEAEKRRRRKVKEEVKEKEKEWEFQVKNLHLTNGDFGFVNQAEDPDYRISLASFDLQLTNFSNRFAAGEAKAHLEGTFMHSGKALATAAFRPEQNGADFDLLVAIEGTRVTTMNDLLRAHAGLDVVSGSFSVYSEIRVHDGRIDGYVKPFIKDIDIYDPKQEEEEGLIGKLKEAVAGTLAKLLENRRDEVATQFDISGPVENPEASSLQIVLQLIRNGFFQAILPGFQKQGDTPAGKDRK
jgi:hypothetical protein